MLLWAQTRVDGHLDDWNIGEFFAEHQAEGDVYTVVEAWTCDQEKNVINQESSENG